MTDKPNIVLGVTGSIAAYKAAEIVRLMRVRDWNVWVMMTKGATKFVSALTFHTLSRNPVAVKMFDRREEWKPEHISLAEQADVLLIAPCTANVMAKLAYGMADDILSCTALATEAPLIIAPAMNEKMWDHPATQTNVKILHSRGAHIMEVGTGDLACGYQGRGCMAPVDTIMAALITQVEQNTKGTS